MYGCYWIRFFVWVGNVFLFRLFIIGGFLRVWVWLLFLMSVLVIDVLWGWLVMMRLGFLMIIWLFFGLILIISLFVFFCVCLFWDGVVVVCWIDMIMSIFFGCWWLSMLLLVVS